MRSWITKMLSFLIKELHEIRRQPRLLVSLIGGPFLVLAVFGATFKSANPVLRTVLVWPENGIPGVDVEELEEVINRNFELVAITDDRAEAMQLLETGRADVVQVVPEFTPEEYALGRRPEVRVYSYAIDPAAEIWIRSLAFSEAHYINRQVLLAQTGRAQQQALTIQDELEQAQLMLARVETSLTPERQQQAEDTLSTLRGILNLLVSIMPPTIDEESSIAREVQEVRGEIGGLINEIDELESALLSGQIQEQAERLERMNAQLDRLQESISTFANLPPQVIVSPFMLRYQNLRGSAYNLVIYYAPGVLALLIQHLAITLGALGLVRERLMGSFELFRVAPLNYLHLLLGKTIAYSIYVLVAGGALALLLRVLKVPILGSPLLFTAEVLLLTLASVGIGLLISVVSTSDSQAVQLTMISLLLSIFFTGFFLPLKGFSSLARPISMMIPMTHGLAGFQQVMLLGRPPDTGIWLGLGSIFLGAYLLVLLVIRRVYRRVLA